MDTLYFTTDTIRLMGLQVLAVYMLLRCAEQEGIAPVQHQWIVDHMPPKTGPNTVTAALRWLTNPEHQIAIRVTGGWRLNRENSFQLPLTYGPNLVNENRAGSDFHSHSDFHSQSDFGSKTSPSAIPEHENRAERDSSFAYPLNTNVNVNTESLIDSSLTLTTDENRAGRGFHSERGFSPAADVDEMGAPGLSQAEVKERLKVLSELGIFANKANTIATDHHVTVEDMRAHVLLAKAEDWERPLGMAIYRLLNHVPAPDMQESGHVVGCRCDECNVNTFPRYTGSSWPISNGDEEDGE